MLRQAYARCRVFLTPLRRAAVDNKNGRYVAAGYTISMMAKMRTYIGHVSHRLSLQRLVSICGVVAVALALPTLTVRQGPGGLLALSLLALAVLPYPLTGRRRTLPIVSSAPILAIMAVYGSAWATVVAAASLLTYQWWTAPSRGDPWAAGHDAARGGLAAACAGILFAVCGGRPGEFAPALLLPPLFAAEAALVAVPWALAWVRSRTRAPCRERAEADLLAAVPALVSEPVLALVLAVAAVAPSPATAFAAALPLAALIGALRLHARGHERLEQAHDALGRAHERLRVQATTDALTGLSNRSHFEETLTARIEEAARYAQPLSVLLLDLDGFKRINDAYGHAAGDAVLAAVGATLRRELRASDLPARLGGDEFVALLPHTDAASALALAERVRAAIAAIAAPTGTTIAAIAAPTGTTIGRPAASVGVASTEGHAGIDGAALVAAADRAAYAAKAAGKNAARGDDDAARRRGVA